MARRVSYLPRSSPRRFFRPCLEALEARWLPAAVFIPQGESPPEVSGAVRPLSDFTNVAPALPDANQVSLGFAINFFDHKKVTTAYVNNNGNITFDSALSAFNSTPLGQLGHEILAPFFADVDTSAEGSGAVSHTATLDGHNAFITTWTEVSPPTVENFQTESFARSGGLIPQGFLPPSNVFQAVLIDRSDIAKGDFDLEFNYNSPQWTPAEFEVPPQAQAGFATGPGAVNPSSFQLPGSPNSYGDLLETLNTTSLNSVVTGRHVFFARDGVLAETYPPVFDLGAPQKLPADGHLHQYVTFATAPAIAGSTVSIDYGDPTHNSDTKNPNTQTLTNVTNATFVLDHTYSQPKIYTITVTVTNGTSQTVHVVDVSADITSLASKSATPGTPTTVSLPAEPGSSRSGGVTYTQSKDASVTSTVQLAFYNADPTPKGGSGVFIDIFISNYNPDPANPVVLTYNDPSLGTGPVTIYSVDKSGNRIQIATTNAVNGNVTITFPPDTKFGGTIFAITTFNPTTTSATIQPPVVQANTGTAPGVATDASLGLALSVTFTSSTQLSVPLTASQNGQVAVSGSSQGAVTGPLRGSSFSTTRSGSNQEQTTDDGEAAFWRWLQSDENGQLLIPTDPPQPLPRKKEESSSAKTEPVVSEMESMVETPLAQDGEVPVASHAEAWSAWMWLGLLPGLVFRSATLQTQLARIRRVH